MEFLWKFILNIMTSQFAGASISLRPFFPGIPEAMHFRYPEELLTGKDNSSVIENDDHLYDASNMKNALAYLWGEKKTRFRMFW